MGDIQRIADYAKLNRRKMRVKELLPLQALMAQLKQVHWVVARLLPGDVQEDYYVEVSSCCLLDYAISLVRRENRSTHTRSTN